jgi:CheY-like chemotaxis protein
MDATLPIPPKTEPDAPHAPTVLLVDDDPIILMNGVDMLEDLGFTVFDAASADAALVIIETEAVDVLLTDMAMPGGSGTDLIAAVKARWPQIGAVLVTGYGDVPGGTPENVGLLTKPYDQPGLHQAVKSAMDKQ